MMVNLGQVSARWSVTSAGVSHVTHVPHWYIPAKHVELLQVNAPEVLEWELMYR